MKNASIPRFKTLAMTYSILEEWLPPNAAPRPATGSRSNGCTSRPASSKIDLAFVAGIAEAVACTVLLFCLMPGRLKSYRPPRSHFWTAFATKPSVWTTNLFPFVRLALHKCRGACSWIFNSPTRASQQKLANHFKAADAKAPLLPSLGSNLRWRYMGHDPLCEQFCQSFLSIYFAWNILV